MYQKDDLATEQIFPKCNNIVHTLFGVFDCHLNKDCCQPCMCTNNTLYPLVLPIGIPVVTLPVAPCKKKEKSNHVLLVIVLNI